MTSLFNGDALDFLDLMAYDLDLIVLDFDLTITKRHTGGHQPKSQLTKDAILQNVYNVDHFRQFVKKAADLEIDLAIASFASQHWKDVGGQTLILRYMDVVLGKDRKVFTGSGDIQAWFPSNRNDKNLHLQFLSQRFGVLPRRMLLIDDDRELNTPKPLPGARS